MRHEVELRWYQDLLLEWAHATPKGAAWVGMGLGKTVVFWTLIRDLLEKKEVRKVLIVAPLKVAEQTWPNERNEWEHLAKIPFTLIRDDNPAVRRQLALMKTKVHIINREQLEWLVKLFAELNAWPYDMLVIDESTSFKDHKTNRFRALRRTLRHYKRIYELTATPALEGYIHLFPQFYILDGGERFGDKVTQFRKKYFEHNPYTRKYELLPGKDEVIVNLINDITIVMEPNDYLPRGKPLMLDRKINLAPKDLEAYLRFEKDLILKLPNDTEIEALTGAALNMKLMQAASGAVYDEAKNTHPFHDSVLEDLEQLWEEVSVSGTPLMVCYWFQSSRDRIRKRFPQAVVMDRTGKAVKPWNEGKIKMLLVHPQSAGHGLNMQYGPGRDMYFFDLPRSGEYYHQVIARMDRQGQKNIVRVHHALAMGTIAEDARESLRAKGDLQSDLFERLKKRRREIRGR